MIDFHYGVQLVKLEPDGLTETVTLEWRNDPRVWRWCRQNDLITKAGHRAWFENQAKDPSMRMYGVSTKDHALIGVAGLTSVDWLSRRAEFSLYIAPKLQGNGMGESALKTLFSHGFRNLGLNLIWGESFDGNPAIKLFDKLGMTKEGMRRDFYFRDGRFVDAHLFSIKASEWYAKEQADAS